MGGIPLKKGRAVYVEGRLKTRKWQDKDAGADRNATEVIVDQMQMLGGRDESQQGGHAADAPDAAPRQQRRSPPANAAPAGGNVADMDDDIPF